MMRGALCMIFMSLMACSSATSEETKQVSYTVTLSSSGGFTGRGAGSVRVGDDGAYLRVSPTNEESRGKLTDAEQQRLRALLGAAWKGAWSSPPEASRGADLFTYTLVAERNGEKRSLHWREDAEPQLSSDLRRLAEALRAIGR